MTGATDIWAVVPVKITAGAKQRLAGLVPAQLRSGLALAMFEDVVEALSGACGLSGIVVVTVDPAVSAIALRYGARIMPDGPQAGHTAAVASAARQLAAEGRSGMLQVPGDIPLVTAGEISELIKIHRTGRGFTIAPSHDDKGSNAILVSPPDAVPLSFGDDSFHPHLRVARQHGIEPTVVRLPGIALDIDWPEDIAAFTQLRSSTRTRAFLERNGLALVTKRNEGAIAPVPSYERRAGE
jgi:2-phospho-L-lactate guanylyltransferase